jgi:hypothetical protein
MDREPKYNIGISMTLPMTLSWRTSIILELERATWEATMLADGQWSLLFSSQEINRRERRDALPTWIALSMSNVVLSDHETIVGANFS